MHKTATRQLSQTWLTLPGTALDHLVLRNSKPGTWRLFSSASQALAVDEGESQHGWLTRPYQIHTDGGLGYRSTKENNTLKGNGSHTPANRREGRTTKIPKAGRDVPPLLLLQSIIDIERRSTHHLEIAAAARSRRLPILLAQAILRADVSDGRLDSMIAALLPAEKAWKESMLELERTGCTLSDFENYVQILKSGDDEEMSRRFLDQEGNKPRFLLHFILRPQARIVSTHTLSRLIYHSIGSLRKENAPEKNFTSTDCIALLKLLVTHCLRLDARLLAKAADLVVEYIARLAEGKKRPEELYYEQCKVLSRALRLFQAPWKGTLVTGPQPNAYSWEAQRKLLIVSSSYDRPLMIDKDGFKAIREVLAGLTKSFAEQHTVSRHASTWPPYLRAGDGMDEATEPEDNWSRTVRAGVLMQEAGYSKNLDDEALDTMAGTATDGTPTIQQRARHWGGARRTNVWKASMLATRNVHEAWHRFNHPPAKDCQPGLDQYEVMFEKLMLRDANHRDDALPGDKALNFPQLWEANLSELEKLRLQPPTVVQLYERMREDGIQPTGRCLRILIGGADSVEAAHQYLEDSDVDPSIVLFLTAPTAYQQANPQALKDVSLGLLHEYIKVCSKVQGPTARDGISRAMHLAELAQELGHQYGAAVLWEPVLRNLSQSRITLYLSLEEQLRLITEAFDQKHKHKGFMVSSFRELARCVRKVTKRELDALYSEFKFSGRLESDLIMAMYDPPRPNHSNRMGKHDGLESEVRKGDQEPARNMAVPHPFAVIRQRLRDAFSKMAHQENEMQELLQTPEISIIDRITARKDVFKAPQIYDYMQALAYMGEFEEMASVLQWVISQWRDPAILEAMASLGATPKYANFSEVLCHFRVLAEPMLGEEAVLAIQDAIADAGLDWTWPDGEALQSYERGLENSTVSSLKFVLQQIQERRRTGA